MFHVKHRYHKPSPRYQSKWAYHEHFTEEERINFENLNHRIFQWRKQLKALVKRRSVMMHRAINRAKRANKKDLANVGHHSSAKNEAYAQAASP